MSIFTIEQQETPAAELLAKGFLSEANQQFETQLEAAYDAVERFWRRNTDPKGDKVVERVEGGTTEPTGVEILQAMGVNAQAAMTVAYLRVQMLLQIEAALGLSGVVDVARVTAPFELTFNQDGSLKEAKPRT